MTSYPTLLFAMVFHAALLTCEKPAPDISKNSPDIPDTIIEEIPNDEALGRHFHDNMPNALEGAELLMIPDDFIPDDVDVQPRFHGGQPALRKYIDKYLEIPDAVPKFRINGNVHTSFTLPKPGK
ncbi:hypothetical protein [Dyadobacter sp. 676]|uniref:Nuclear transport factor 2 family protein n=1 Tax=Dyadobacter sp. 676 TaxID=3088362 RepID=A0AAU8FNU0_9BACT